MRPKPKPLPFTGKPMFYSDNQISRHCAECLAANCSACDALYERRSRDWCWFCVYVGLLVAVAASVLWALYERRRWKWLLAERDTRAQRYCRTLPDGTEEWHTLEFTAEQWNDLQIIEESMRPSVTTQYYRRAEAKQ